MITQGAAEADGRRLIWLMVGGLVLGLLAGCIANRLDLFSGKQPPPKWEAAVGPEGQSLTCYRRENAPLLCIHSDADLPAQ